MDIKFAPNLYLDVTELNRLKTSLGDKGFRKHLLQNAHSFGLIRNSLTDPTFLNGLVQPDVNGQVLINACSAIDSSGSFVELVQQKLTIPNNSNWYWISVGYSISNNEVGTFSIAADGTLTGVGSKMTEWRGQPNFPTRITFLNSLNNTLEYDVLSVTSDTQCIVSHPSLTVAGLPQFIAESNLTVSIVGTFTNGITVQFGDKYPFIYDSASISLLGEALLDTPNVAFGSFALARVKNTSTGLVIQDKRGSFFMTRAEFYLNNVSQSAAPIVGVESVQWNNVFSSGDKNLIKMGWGMRSNNFTVDSSHNVVSLYGSSLGGAYKSLAQFTDGDFNGFRVYTQNGKYSRVVSSLKQGSAVNLYLDNLYSFDYLGPDTSLISQYITVVPDADEIEFRFKAVSSSGSAFPYLDKVVSSNIALGVDVYEILCYDAMAYYTIEYRFKTHSSYSSYFLIASDLINGYYDENSFTNGALNIPTAIVKTTYSSSLVNGFIKLLQSPDSIKAFENKVFKGDIIGVNVITSFANSVNSYVVGSQKKYNYITGTLTLTNDITIILDEFLSVDGNEFIFHFNCTDINLNNHTITISQQDSGTSAIIPLKVITQADIYSMKNKANGIKLSFVYSVTQKWILSQDYAGGSPKEIKMIDNVPSAFFDGNGLGKVQGLYGYAICNGNNGTPDLTSKFIMGSVSDIAAQQFGGNNSITLDANQLPAHTHSGVGLTTSVDQHAHRLYLSGTVSGSTKDVFSYAHLNENQSDDIRLSLGTTAGATPQGTDTYGHSHTVGGATASTGNGTAIDITPKFYSLIYCKKLF